MPRLDVERLADPPKQGFGRRAREIAHHAASEGKSRQARAIEAVVDGILARPEHEWFEQGAGEQAAQIREEMERRYGQGGAEDD